MNSHVLKYKDVGEYLSKSEKLKFIRSSTIDTIDWAIIEPDENGDWINLRDENYDQFVPIDKVYNSKVLGVGSSRDSWVYSFNRNKAKTNTERMVDNYNYEVRNNDENSVNNNSDYISWSRSLRVKFKKRQIITLDENNLQVSLYRPFTKKWLYYDPQVIENGKGLGELFENGNLSIIIPGTGSRREFSCFVTKNIPDLNLFDAGTQVFVENNLSSDLFNEMHNLTPLLPDVSIKENIYYIYAILHSPVYRKKYANDLQKNLPHIPLIRNKEKYIEIGKKLVELHLNYENQPQLEEVEVLMSPLEKSYEVIKMRHPKKGVLNTIIYT